MLLRFRNELAVAGTVLIFAALLAMPKIQLSRTHELPPPTMQVTLEAPPAPPIPVTPPPTPVPPLPPQPAVAESAEHPLAPPPKAEVKKIIKPHHVKPVPLPPVTPPAPATPPTQAAPPAPPAQAAPPAPPAAGPVNASYAGLITAEIKAAQHYPTGREALTQHPEGTATVSFTLSRSGQLISADIETASGSLILDKAALETVQRQSYPPFPDASFPGETQHTFSVNLNYIAPSS
jgi:protein TonB